MPTTSSLDNKISDIVGNINFYFSENKKIGYKFTLDNDLEELHYNQISTDLEFGKGSYN